MRKLKISLAIFFAGALFVGSLAYAVPDPQYGQWDNMSEKTGDKFPVRDLKMVRNPANGVNTAGLASGDAVVYSLISDDGISIATTTTSADGAFAGVLVTAALTADQTGSTSFLDDRGKRNWAWMLVHGPVIAKVSAGGTNAHSAGDAIITSTDAGALTSMLANTVSVPTEMIRRGANRGGFFLDAATAANTSEEVFVQLE